MKIWVFAESEGDKPTTATLELLTKARELGTVECVYAGTNADAIAPALGEHGAARCSRSTRAISSWVWSRQRRSPAWSRPRRPT